MFHVFSLRYLLNGNCDPPPMTSKICNYPEEGLEFFQVPRPMYRGAYFFIFPSYFSPICSWWDVEKSRDHALCMGSRIGTWKNLKCPSPLPKASQPREAQNFSKSDRPDIREHIYSYFPHFFMLALGLGKILSSPPIYGIWDIFPLYFSDILIFPSYFFIFSTYFLHISLILHISCI